MTQENFIISIFALRYAISRESSANYYVYQYLHKHLDDMNREQKQQLKDEIIYILNHIKYDTYLSDLLEEM